MNRYRTILIDPPWQETMVGRFTRHSRADRLPYKTLSADEIRRLPIPNLADANCHLWLWTTNRTLRQGFDLIDAWGFRYLCPVHWIKPSGFGAWFVHRTQTMLFAYRGKLRMDSRYRPNVLFAPSRRHSQKPQCSYELIEAVSFPSRLEMFARNKRDGWHVWGNEVENDIAIAS